jgi:Tfp pilus assembly protein PilV
MNGLLIPKNSRIAGFTLSQTMIAMTIMLVILGAVYTSSTALLGSMKASENYSVGQLMAMDYLSLDLRRATTYSFTTSGTTLTLPLNLTLPTFYAADGHTANAPQRVLVTSANTKDKKKHKVFSARYFYTYGTFGSTVAVQYYLSNGTLYRKEGSYPARPIGSNIATVVFGPTAGAAPYDSLIAADPMVTTTITFNPSLRAKQAPVPLSSTTFMRQYYYSDYN